MMAIVLANVVFSTWQAVLLIVLCFGSLVIALYCLFFMVPLKSFVQRINSLGGGMQGMRAHVDGVRSEIEKQIAALESLVRRHAEATRAEMEVAVDSAAEAARKGEAAVQRLAGAVEGLQAESAGQISASREAAAELSALRGELGELRHDFELLQGELSGSIRRMVSQSYQTLEGTFTAALAAVSDEMLRGSGTLRNGRESRPSVGPGANGLFGDRGRQGLRQDAPSKIISAQPLFAQAERPEPVEGGHEEQADAEAGRTEEQESPAT